MESLSASSVPNGWLWPVLVTDKMIYSTGDPVREGDLVVFKSQAANGQYLSCTENKYTENEEFFVDRGKKGLQEHAVHQIDDFETTASPNAMGWEVVLRQEAPSLARTRSNLKPGDPHVTPDYLQVGTWK